MESVLIVEGTPSIDTLETAYWEFLKDWQDPTTGYWGAWYRTGNDEVYRTSDLSITYHTIAYRRGDVPRWPEIVATTMSIHDSPYPYGWLFDGQYSNHNNYDVVKILRFGWPYMTNRQKADARAAIEKMLRWCVSRSLDSEGMFSVDPGFFTSLSDAFYFGASFLDVIGYWDRNKRFWTASDLGDTLPICCRLKRRLTAVRLGTPMAANALERLNANCPICPANGEPERSAMRSLGEHAAAGESEPR